MNHVIQCIRFVTLRAFIQDFWFGTPTPITMSDPTSDPPVPPPDPPNGSLKDESTSPANDNDASTIQTPAPTEDIKMEEVKPIEDTFDDIPESVLKVGRRLVMMDFLRVSFFLHFQADPQEIKSQTRMIDNEIRMMRQENLRLAHEREQMVEKTADNTTKIKQNKVLPYLVSKVVSGRISDDSAGSYLGRQVLDVDSEIQEGATHNEQNAKKSKCAVIKTSTRQVRSTTKCYNQNSYEHRLSSFPSSAWYLMKNFDPLISSASTKTRT